MPKPTRTPERIDHSQDAITHEAAVAIAKAHNGGCSCPCHAALQSPAGEWRDISTAPKDGTTVLLFRKHSHQYIHNRSKDGLYYPCRWVNGRWSGWAHRAVDYPPTHWLPLSPAPTGEVE